ncbi:MAG TPA: FoF1 ATP synthase subunit gamma [Acidobacteriaceae bacterium]|jgi:F-type H+-transporting ATPase subunit gamma|nr:FoF1 ATP synthase subunit gamma [Acidobacteriaceae bacterium]
MPSVLDLRRRIRSVKNTRQITKAMKLVSAAKLRRAQERAIAARPYARMIASVIQSLARRVDLFDPETGELRHPLLLSRPEKTVALIVVSGDKGFAGAFNGNITKAAFRFIASKGQEPIDIEAIGRKGRDLFVRRYGAPVSTAPKDDQEGAEEQAVQPRQRRAPIEVTGEYPGMLDKLSFDRVAELGGKIVDSYIREEIDAAYIVYNEFKSVIAQRVVVEKILPIIEVGRADVEQTQEMNLEERERAAKAALSSGVTLKEPESQDNAEADKFGTAQVDYIYEQPPHQLLDGLLRQYITTQLYHAMTESVAAEHAARMTAMDSATNNASDLIDSLTLTMNRVRQAAITKEIIEIVSGAAAL